MQNWPLSVPMRAWTPPTGETEALAVPLLKTDKVLTWDQYLDRLRARIRWMAEAEVDPHRVVEEMWWDQMGRLAQLNPNLPVDKQLVEGELLPVLAEEHGLRPEMFPAKVRSQPVAVEAVGGRELLMWLVSVLPVSDR